MARTKKSLKDTLLGAEDNAAASLDPNTLSRFKNIATRMYETPVLTAAETAYPAIANMGRTLAQKIADNYQQMFFVQILRLDMLYVALINALIGIYDVLNNPLMGIAYDKTRTRWGKARPYVMLSPTFYFLSVGLMFTGALFINNDNTQDPRKIMFVFVMLFLRETFSTIYTIPVDNMISLISPNPTDRMNMGLLHTFFYKWSGDFLAGMFMPLMDFAKQGYLPVSQAAIFAGFGMVSALFGIGGTLFLALGSKERIILQPKPAPLNKTLFYMLKNKYEMRKFAADLAGSWWSKGGYNWDVIFQLEVLGGFFRSMGFFLPRQISQIISLTLVPRFKKMFNSSYRKTVLFMRSTDFAFSCISAWIGSRKKITGTWWKVGSVFAVFDFVQVLNDAPSTVLESEVNREISDYTEFMTGERPDGTQGLLWGLIKKVTTPLNALMTIAVFRWTGYNPNIGSQGKWDQQVVRDNVQVYSRVYGIWAVADIVPNILNAIPLFFYDLEGVKKDEMYRALNERRALIAKESSMNEEMKTLIGQLSQDDIAEDKV
ncbi:MAG: MFS transporter [Oscillospiraceae bacterium]|nr:MFS transporter [Oscillospiraceae bacterium]